MGFNASFQSHLPTQKSLIHFLSVIEHPPTDLATVKEITHQSRLILDRLQLSEISLLFDQAIYLQSIANPTERS